MLFYYFGDDEAYFRALAGEFGNHTRMPIEFKRIFEADERSIQSLFLNVYNSAPACVFIDFSKMTQDYMHLARIISRTPIEHKMISVGLVDYLSPPEVMMESIATGVTLTHIKSAETFDVVFDVIKLIAPNEMGEHGFATATLSEDWEAGIPVKVGFVETDSLHFETDYKLQKGDRIRMNHHWTEKKIVPSREFFVKETSTQDLFYHFKYAVDAEFVFIDEFLPPEDMEEERIQERKAERDQNIIYHQKQLSRWIDDNASRSLEKKAKVLVIDKEFHFYHHQQRTDKHAYTIRCIPFLEDIGVEIDRMHPQVIAFALDNAEDEDPKNTKDVLKKLVAALKAKMPERNPFIVIFNSTENSKTLQDDLSYTQLMATENELAVDVLVRMADVYEKKMSSLPIMQKPKSRGKEDKKVFLKKTNSASICEILIPIKVVKLSETDLLLQTDVELNIGMNLHLTSPVDMFVNIQPFKGQSKVPLYHGLIHCLGEEEKKELRKFVNSVFFREHDAKVTADQEVFKKLNEDKLNLRLEAEKKAQLEREELERSKAETKAEAEAEKASQESDVPSDS